MSAGVGTTQHQRYNDSLRSGLHQASLPEDIECESAAEP